MDLDDVLAVVNDERVASLSLSKGGWEGWLQCELWRYLTIHKNESVEREVKYPNDNSYCDLVCGDNLWVEIKAFGVFREGDAGRFMDSVAGDVGKMDRRPSGCSGLVLVVVPNAIGEVIFTEIDRRRWAGFVQRDATYVRLFYKVFEAAP